MRRSRLLLFLAFVFLIKLVIVVQLRDHPLLQPDAGIDTSAYVALANRVRSGDFALGPGLYFVSPLYIYWLAGVLTLFDSFTAVRVLQAALGTAGVGCVFVAARQWFGRRAAWIAALAAALTGIFTFYEAILLQAALDPALTAAALAALAMALTTDRRPDAWALASGVLFGLQTLNRPNIIVAVACVVVVLLAGANLRAAVLLAIGLALALAPVAARNRLAAGVWMPVPSQGGLNFYIGNNPEADGTYHSVEGITPNIAGQARDTKRVAEKAAGHPLTDAQVSEYFYRRGLYWIRDHRRAAAVLLARKIVYTVNAAHIPLNDSYVFYARDAGTWLAVLTIGAWLLIPLGLAGLAAAAPRDQWPPYLAWAAFTPGYIASVAIFFASDRYRLPLLVPMCAGAGACLDRLLPRARGSAPAWIGRGALAAGVLVCAAVVNWPLDLDDGRSEERTRMAEWSAVSGDAAQAQVWATRAEAVSRDPAVVNLRVGRALLEGRDPGDAVRRLERAAMLAPDRPEVDYALGEALLDAGRPAEAIGHLRKAVAARVRPDVAGVDLVRALMAAGSPEEARRALDRVEPANPSDGDSWLALGDLAVRLDAPALEARFYGRAVQASPRNPVAHLNYAVTLAQDGRLADARREAAEALRLKPDYERARQMLETLGK